MGDTAATLTDTATAVSRINLALQGPVVDVLGQFLPELNALPRDQAYDRAMGDIDLLTRCFQIFRRERSRFRHILVDERRRPVTDDSVPLSCGRTLAEVIAMIVRTAAKRYFRRVLAVPRTALGAMSSRRADELYEEIRAYLLHDWQVPLVPAYAEMEPALVRRIGARLLDAREPDSLARLIADPEGAVLSPPPVPVTDEPVSIVLPPPPEPAASAVGALPPGRVHPMTARLEDILTEDHQRLRPEAFTPSLLDPEVRAALPNADNVRIAAEILRGVSGAPAATLVDGLGLRKDHLAVLLLVAHDCIGTTVFGRLFGPRAEPELVIRIVERARLYGLGPESGVIECAIFMRSVFARFGHRSRREG